jgi:hypothetical protein
VRELQKKPAEDSNRGCGVGGAQEGEELELKQLTAEEAEARRVRDPVPADTPLLSVSVVVGVRV